MKTKILFLTMFLFSIQVWAIEYDMTLVLNENTTINIDTLARTEWVIGSASTINNVKVKNGSILTVLLNNGDEVSFEGMRNMEWVDSTAVMKKAGTCTFRFKRGGATYGVRIHLNYFGELEYEQGEDTVSFPATLVPIITIKNSEIILSNYDTNHLSTTQTLGYENNDLTNMRVGFFGFRDAAIGTSSNTSCFFWSVSTDCNGNFINFAYEILEKGIILKTIMEKAKEKLSNNVNEFYVKATINDGTSNYDENYQALGLSDYFFKVKDERVETVTITFKAGPHGKLQEEDSNGEINISVNKGTLFSNITVPATIADDGYLFDTWEPTLPSGNTPINTDACYTAKFKPIETVTVTFDSDGGTSVPSQVINKGTTATQPTDPTKEGFVFKHWALSGAEFNFNTPINSNITLKAIWESIIIHPTSVSVSPTEKTLEIGETQQLTATVLPVNATDKSVTWKSSNPSIATVSTNGLVTAKSAGSAAITVKTNDGNKTATCTITVNAAVVPVASVTVTPTAKTLEIGDTEQLTATVLPANATDKSVTWESSNPSIATVSANGLVTAKAAGSATITVKTNDGGKTATCSISVKEKTATLILTASPSEGGTVSGAGTFEVNTTVTAQATVNEGFAFVGWLEGTNQVSTDVNYSFTITENRTLMAHFERETNIDEIENIALNIYPNPTTGIIHIKIDNYDSLNAHIKVYSMNGNEIYLPTTTGYESTILDLSPCPNGHYMIKVIYSDKVVIKKVLKN